MSEQNSQNYPNQTRQVVFPWKVLTAVIVISVIGAAIVSSLIVSKGIIFGSKSETEKKFNISGSIINKNEILAKTAAQVIKTKLDAAVVAVNAYANDDGLVRFIMENKWDEAARASAGLRKDFPSVELLFLSDMTGVMKSQYPLVLPQILGQNFAYQDWYRGVTSEFKPYISDVFELPAGPRYNVVALAVPVLDKNGTPIAILGVQMKLEIFLGWAQEIRIGKGGVLFVVDKKGQIVVHPEYPPQGEIVDFSSERDVQKVVARQSGTDIFFDNPGFVSSYEPVSGYNWGVIFRIPISEAK